MIFGSVCSGIEAASGGVSGGGSENFVTQPIPIHDKATRHKGGGRAGDDGSSNGLGIGKPGDMMPTMDTSSRHSLCYESQVRRLTPRECERLQGFPDDYTLVPNASDSARYKAIGNSWAVPKFRWIGERIKMIDELIATT